jgi:hypothetical protein
MIYNSKNENNEGEAGNFVEKTTGKFELKKIASRKFEEEEEEEEKQPV